MKALILLMLLAGLLFPLRAQVFIPVMVNPPPLPIATAGNDTSVSVGTHLVLNASHSGGTAPFSYRWSPGHLLNDSTVLNPTFIAGITTLFTFSVRDASGCEASDDMLVTVTGVGLNDISERQIKLFPNPAFGKLNISAHPGWTDPVTLSLSTILGEQELHYTGMIPASGLQWDVSHLPPGIYLFRISLSDQSRVQKIILL
jgi:hypothetical protein